VRVYLRPTPTACCRFSITACAAGITSTSWWRQTRLPQWLTMDEAWCIAQRELHLAMGQQRPGSPRTGRSDACCGDTPTLEILAPFPSCASICRTENPVVNVVDLMKLQSASEHSHGLSEQDYTRCSRKTNTSYLVSMDTRRWSTGSPTGPTTTCTFEATKKRAPSRLL